MANTIIQIRHSTDTGAVPASLANGEISINTRDGRIFYGHPTGSVNEFPSYPGPSGLNKEVQFNDSGNLGTDPTFIFDKVTDTLQAPILKSSYSNGEEGGEIELNTATSPYNLLSGNVIIDVTRNQLRIFESGGTKSRCFH